MSSGTGKQEKEKRNNESKLEELSNLYKFVADYYLHQRIVSEDSLEEFLNIIKTPLLTVFYVHDYSRVKVIFKKLLESPKTTECFSAFPTPLSWFKNECVWKWAIKDDFACNGECLELKHFLNQQMSCNNIIEQDVLDMLPIILLDADHTHKVLDMSGRTNQKFFQISDLIQLRNGVGGDGLMVVVESNLKKCHTMSDSFTIHSSPRLTIVNLDPKHLPLMNFTSDDESTNLLMFDRVFAFLPSSNDGRARNNPEVIRSWTWSSSLSHHGNQCELLNSGLGVLKIGGRLVYAVKSMNPVEGEAVISTVLYQQKGSVELVDVTSELEDIIYEQGITKWEILTNKKWYKSADEVPQYLWSQVWTSMFPLSPEITGKQHLDRCIRILPHKQNTSGIFVGVLKRVEYLDVVVKREEEEMKKKLEEDEDLRKKKHEEEVLALEEKKKRKQERKKRKLELKEAKKLLQDSAAKDDGDAANEDNLTSNVGNATMAGIEGSEKTDDDSNLNSNGLDQEEMSNSEMVESDENASHHQFTEIEIDIPSPAGEDDNLCVIDTIQDEADDETSIKPCDVSTGEHVNRQTTDIEFASKKQTGMSSSRNEDEKPQIGKGKHAGKVKVSEIFEMKQIPNLADKSSHHYQECPIQENLKAENVIDVPISVLDCKNPFLDEIKSFFGLSSDFPFHRLYVRIFEDVPFYCYLVSDVLNKILKMNLTRYKFVSVGVKVFAYMSQEDVDCKLRITQEGAKFIYPFMSRQIVQSSKKDMIIILSKPQIEVCNLSPSLQNKISRMERGSFIISYEPSTGDDLDGPIILSCLKINNIYRCFLSEYQRSFCLRQLGVPFKNSIVSVKEALLNLASYFKDDKA